MSVDPEAEIDRLREQLNHMLAQARDNEGVMRRLQLFELKLIQARGLRELINALLFDYKQTFALDAVTLVLADPEHELRRMLEDAGVEPGSLEGLGFLDDEESLRGLLEAGGAPVLGPFEASRHAVFFPGANPAPASVALLPLSRSQQLSGSLNLASADPSRFIAGMATDFMARLAAIVAICLENVANQERLRYLGMTDSLTGVYNRRYFDQRLREEADRSLRSGQALCCMMLDVDHFKRINDVFGHAAGDMVLREMTLRIKAQLRTSDVMARYGGEEFAVLLTQTGIEAALAIAERIRQTVADARFIIAGGTGLAVTMSLGVAMLDRTGQAGAAAAAMVAEADAAMYRAKNAGRNRVHASAELPDAG
ncbi:MAG: sensor domain-containing diguanylate cyclase [Burkholderiales bacterium]|nr:sensor domain-containing diguanylate cyclase [Burkholderiales bacterium]